MFCKIPLVYFIDSIATRTRSETAYIMSPTPNPFQPQYSTLGNTLSYLICKRILKNFIFLIQNNSSLNLFQLKMSTTTLHSAFHMSTLLVLVFCPVNCTNLSSVSIPAKPFGISKAWIRLSPNLRFSGANIPISSSIFCHTPPVCPSTANGWNFAKLIIYFMNIREWAWLPPQTLLAPLWSPFALSNTQ